MKITNVEVSGEYAGYPKGNAVDGNINTWWNSGGFAPQSIEIDLDKPVEELYLRWMPQMTPTTGVVKVEYLLINKDSHQICPPIPHQYDCQIARWVEQHLTVPPHRRQPEIPDNKISRIHINFIASPSWIALREIEVKPV